MKRALAVTAVVFLVFGIGRAANAQALVVTGLGGQSSTFTSADIAKLSHVKLRVKQHDQERVFDGVPLSVLLDRVGAPSGEKLRGADMTDVVLVTAHKGYQVALALAETDPAMSHNAVILADKMDGVALNTHDGPFRLIVEADGRPARAARMVDAISILRVGTAAKHTTSP